VSNEDKEPNYAHLPVTYLFFGAVEQEDYWDWVSIKLQQLQGINHETGYAI
jgi:hypothetical protein